MVRTGRVTRPVKLGRFLLVGATVLAVGSAFLYVGGWLTPHKLTPSRFVDTFQQVNGPHPGFRRNHAKGVGVSGTFESNGQGARLSKAAVFRPGRVPIVGRFSLSGGMPYQSDELRTIRGMALQFLLPDGEEWRTAMTNIPVFVVNTPQAFREQLVAMEADTKTGKPDPAKVKAFLDGHPESARAMQTIQAQVPSSGFDDSTYNSLNAFWLVDATGRSTPVRWSMVPAQPLEPVAPAPQGDPSFLFDALIARLHRQPLRWRLVLTIGQPGDPTNDATIAWPEDREKLDVGTLTIDSIESEASSPARTINFDPLILPDGIIASDDPVLSARSATYSVSFQRRVGEPVSPSAVTPAEVAQ
jgi:catalase